MPGLHLKQVGFTNITFTKHRERIQKFRETCYLNHLYRNEIDKDKIRFRYDFKR